jgi:hypothetical protein
MIAFFSAVVAGIDDWPVKWGNVKREVCGRDRRANIQYFSLPTLRRAAADEPHSNF